ncbi:MAG: universal stress protein [Negativicutes bacterium]|nr:universal stress protein [Negativicutes bacterium]
MQLKILVPLDGSEKSTHSLLWLKKFFSKDEAEITLLNVIELSAYIPQMSSFGESPLYDFSEMYEISKKRSTETLEEGEKMLDGYRVTKLSLEGQSGSVILDTAKEGGFDLIVMTKSSVMGLSRLIGSVTSKIVRDSEVAVVVIPE